MIYIAETQNSIINSKCKEHFLVDENLSGRILPILLATVVNHLFHRRALLSGSCKVKVAHGNVRTRSSHFESALPTITQYNFCLLKVISSH